jgi:malate/lactate dehydrogenase
VREEARAARLGIAACGLGPIRRAQVAPGIRRSAEILIEDFLGVHDVCLSLPSVVNRDGVQRILPVPLSPGEAKDLQRSPPAVRAVVKRLGL